jgi:hypothetical protein
LTRLGLLDGPPEGPEEHRQPEETRIVVLLRWSSPRAFREPARAAQALAVYDRLLVSLCSRITIRNVGGAAPPEAAEVRAVSGEQQAQGPAACGADVIDQLAG